MLNTKSLDGSSHRADTMGMTFTHCTVDGTRYGIDADGRVLAPDADGNPDQLTLGTVRRCAANPRYWVSDPGATVGVQTDHATRADGIRSLA